MSENEDISGLNQGLEAFKRKFFAAEENDSVEREIVKCFTHDALKETLREIGERSKKGKVRLVGTERPVSEGDSGEVGIEGAEGSVGLEGEEGSQVPQGSSESPKSQEADEEVADETYDARVRKHIMAFIVNLTDVNHDEYKNWKSHCLLALKRTKFCSRDDVNSYFNLFKRLTKKRLTIGITPFIGQIRRRTLEIPLRINEGFSDSRREGVDGDDKDAEGDEEGEVGMEDSLCPGGEGGSKEPQESDNNDVRDRGKGDKTKEVEDKVNTEESFVDSRVEELEESAILKLNLKFITAQNFHMLKVRFDNAIASLEGLPEDYVEGAHWAIRAGVVCFTFCAQSICNSRDVSAFEKRLLEKYGMEEGQKATIENTLALGHIDDVFLKLVERIVDSVPEYQERKLARKAKKEKRGLPYSMDFDPQRFFGRVLSQHFRFARNELALVIPFWLKGISQRKMNKALSFLIEKTRFNDFICFSEVLEASQQKHWQAEDILRFSKYLVEALQANPDGSYVYRELFGNDTEEDLSQKAYIEGNLADYIVKKAEEKRSLRKNIEADGSVFSQEVAPNNEGELGEGVEGEESRRPVDAPQGSSEEFQEDRGGTVAEMVSPLGLGGELGVKNGEDSDDRENGDDRVPPSFLKKATERDDDVEEKNPEGVLDIMKKLLQEKQVEEKSPEDMLVFAFQQAVKAKFAEKKSVESIFGELIGGRRDRLADVLDGVTEETLTIDEEEAVQVCVDDFLANRKIEGEALVSLLSSGSGFTREQLPDLIREAIQLINEYGQKRSVAMVRGAIIDYLTKLSGDKKIAFKSPSAVRPVEIEKSDQEILLPEELRQLEANREWLAKISKIYPYGKNLPDLGRVTVSIGHFLSTSISQTLPNSVLRVLNGALTVMRECTEIKGNGDEKEKLQKNAKFKDLSKHVYSLLRTVHEREQQREKIVSDGDAVLGNDRVLSEVLDKKVHYESVLLDARREYVVVKEKLTQVSFILGQASNVPEGSSTEYLDNLKIEQEALQVELAGIEYVREQSRLRLKLINDTFQNLLKMLH